MLNILNVPDKTLRQKSSPIKKIDSKTIDFIDQLSNTLINKTNPPGVGLSAVQVGHPISVFVTYLPKDRSLPANKWDKSNLQLTIYINPQIVKTSRKTTLGGSKNRPSIEGCLSIPHLWGPVYRHDWVELRYQTLDPDNKLIDTSERFKSFSARVIQHEYDHLQGILFTDHNQRDNLPLYMEENKELVLIENPQPLLKW